jgi:CubicO group peptidase (beta-lactamase class C family)
LQELTIKHLLSHTSGLPDYFQGKGANGKSLENEITEGNDQFWTFEQAIERTKNMSALFVPGTKGKANYSDANFQLLGKIIDNTTHKSYAENCRELIIQPLGLTKTYLYKDSTDKTPKTCKPPTNPIFPATEILPTFARTKIARHATKKTHPWLPYRFGDVCPHPRLEGKRTNTAGVRPGTGSAQIGIQVLASPV